MNQKGFVNILVIIGLVVLAGIAGYFIRSQTPSPIPIPSPTPTPVGCTLEGYQCPDGSYVGRVGPNCEFAKCPGTHPSPIIKSECKKDSDCPSQYICQETMGSATVCSSNDTSCIPTHTFVKGVCKLNLKEGSRCRVNSDCVGGLLCHASVCTNPGGRQCNGPSDTSCPTDYGCARDCGPPVVRVDDNIPPSYHCLLEGYNRSCPICLAGRTLIDTPSGLVLIKDLQVGMPIWTINKAGHRIPGIIVRTSKVPVPLTHQMVHLVLDDGRELFASPGHPTIDGRTVGDLKMGDIYDGAPVVNVDRVAYGQDATYDVLASGETGFYWANGILVESTLR